MSEFSNYSIISLPIPVLYVIASGLATLVAMRNKLSNASFFSAWVGIGLILLAVAIITG